MQSRGTPDGQLIMHGWLLTLAMGADTTQCQPIRSTSGKVVPAQRHHPAGRCTHRRPDTPPVPASVACRDPAGQAIRTARHRRPGRCSPPPMRWSGPGVPIGLIPSTLESATVIAVRSGPAPPRSSACRSNRSPGGVDVVDAGGASHWHCAHLWSLSTSAASMVPKAALGAAFPQPGTRRAAACGARQAFPPTGATRRSATGRQRHCPKAGIKPFRQLPTCPRRAS